MAKRTKNKSTATGKSPYKKYNKSETRYSAEYYAWNAAAKKGHGAEYEHSVWMKKHGPLAHSARYQQFKQAA